MNIRLQRLTIAFVLTLGTLVADAGAAPPPAGAHLVEALDAAWVRVLDNDIFRNIVAQHGLQDVVINISDCLPSPRVTHFPEQPAGTLKKILDAERVNIGVSAAGILDDGATATRFGSMSQDLLAAVFGELAAHYGSGPVAINYVTIRPPFPITSTLNSGDIDIVGLVNALGGETEDLRRRDSRRFTCTLTATRQVLWLKKDGGPQWRDINDALDDPNVSLCVGPLSNQLSKAYFDGPGQKVKTEYVSDLNKCLRKLINDEADAMMSPFPHERFFPERVDTTGDGKPDTATAGLFRSIDTNIVAGTPLWVALD
jgi:ABC-type amino acid transport substrate-binding protein